MCGVIGYANGGQAAPAILNALKKLEYRGYDSAGLATISNGHIELEKDIGKLHEVSKNHLLSLIPGQTGIGHVRWATHGGVTKENAHPHLDCTGQIAIAHNGIIENHDKLRSRLSGKHKFVSETDSEVIAHLIEENLKNGTPLETAVQLATREIEGSYALLAISTKEPDRIIAARKESPLIIGIGKEGNFLASDALCFLDKTNEIIYVEDNEIVILTDKEVYLLDGEGNRVDRKSQIIDFKWDDATKKGHDYFMVKEIFEQPKVLRETIKQDSKAITEAAMDILRSKRVILTASGTSRYAAIIGRYALSKLAGKFSEVIMASELQYFSESIGKNTLVIAVSQSGETADVIQGVKKAKEMGATILSLVNVPGSTLARMSDRVIYLNCGPEIAVAATKSFTSQLAIFYLLAFAAANKLDDGTVKIRAASRLIDKILNENGNRLSQMAQKLKGWDDFYYIARGINYAIAGEGALKLKEVSYIHAEGLPAGELKHGTLALIEEGTPVVAICPHDYTFSETMSNIAETKARGAVVIGISDKPDIIFDHWIKIPPTDEILYPLVSIVPLQLLAYYLAKARGLDPDKPRNLAKSVTVK